MIRTDLAIECVADAEASGEIPGIEKLETDFGDVAVTRVRVTDERGAAAIGKPVGTYVTISAGDFSHTSGSRAEKALSVAVHELSALVRGKTHGGVLVVGLGNSECTPDALGPKTVSKILVTRHMKKQLSDMLSLPDMTGVSSVAPGVLGQTGLETAEIIRGLTEKVSPSLVIVIDSLAARSLDRLGCTIQVSDTGIAPGSGIGNRRRELSLATLGVPVISVGVPTVVDAVTMAHDILGGGNIPGGDMSRNPAENRGGTRTSDRRNSMIVTPREIDLLIDHSAALVATAINRALHPSLSPEDISVLAG